MTLSLDNFQLIAAYFCRLGSASIGAHPNQISHPLQTDNIDEKGVSMCGNIAIITAIHQE